MGAWEHHRGPGVGRLRFTVWLMVMIPLLTGCGGGSSASHSHALGSAGSVVAVAQRVIRAQLSSNTGYGGPASGPRAQPARLIAFVAADVTNGGIAGVAGGVRQAAGQIGWPLRVFDGQASPSGRARALRQALAENPSGIILGGFDAGEQRAALRAAAARHIPVVGWHAGPRPGPDGAAGLFTNVTTDPLAVARLAALYVIGDSGGRAGVAIFFDSGFAISVAKAQAMSAEIGKCDGCRLLGTIDSPIADAQVRMPALVSDLEQRYGKRLTYMLAINGNYFAGSRAALFGLGITGGEAPYAVAAGDGDASEFERIRSSDYQAASVAEPLYLQGWQLVDELNRALAGRPPSGYLVPPRLITHRNVPSGSVFDPPAPYRADYRRIWGV